MKKSVFFLSLFLFANMVFAQNLKPVAQKIADKKFQRLPFEQVRLFEITSASKQRSEQLKSKVSKSAVMEFNHAAAQLILSSKPETIQFSIPSDDGNNIELELMKVNLFTPDFSVVTSGSNGLPVTVETGLHYQGIVKGNNSSIAAISIFNNEVMGMISTAADGNMTLGKLENEFSGRHILYRQRDFASPPSSGCFTPEYPMTYSPSELQFDDANRSVNCVRLYWEANYDLYQNKGSVANVINYLTGLFNQSKIIYDNDGISTVLSEIYVWNTASPYTGTSTSSLLSQFQSYRNSFNGDLGHLLGLAGGGGIAAGFNGICNSNLDASQCYSGISSSYQNFPTYSWSVEVVTHEQGHLMGSRHTHACVWNGNNTAIDNCGPTAGYGYEGSCSGAPSPGSAGGTIMSYCHLVSGVGINFNNGFGPQPQSVILNRINNGTCLTACTTPSCNMPTGMSTTSITTNSAVFNWTAPSGALSYNVRYKLISSSSWTNVSTTATSYPATGLLSNNNYEWQVQTVCASGNSAMTTSTNFTTASIPCDPPTGMNTNSITTTSATFNWTSVSGAAGYNVRYRAIGNQLWTNGNTTGTSFTANSLAPSTNHEWQVQTNCSSSSSALITIGTGTNQNSGTTYPAPYGNWYWSARHQFLILASELSAQGLVAGNLTSLAFDVVSNPGTANYTDFTIGIRATTATALTTTFDAASFTTVFTGPYTVTSPGWNTHTFSVPFYWDGTSNILINTCSYLNTGYTNNAIVNQTSTSFASSLYYFVDNSNAACSNSTGTTANQRPNIKLGGIVGASALSSFTTSTNFTTASSPCDAPTGMNTTNITSSSATFNWTAVSGAVNYNIQYRATGAPNWTTGTTAGTSFNATSLSPSTNHEWQVQTNCSSSSSAFTTSTNFTTSAAPCNAPTGMTTTAITTTSATFNWNAVSGAMSYNIQYRATGAPNWTTGTATGTSFSATSLAPATNHEWQVQTVCTGGSSTFTASTLFTTLSSVCTDIYEPNNSKNSATTITLSTDYFALINPTGEYDWFKFNNTSTQRNIRVTLTNLPANYNVRLYGTNGNYVAISQNAGTANEIINYNTTTVGTWRVRVDGFNGAFNASQCYTLRAEISSTPFASPEGMVGEDIVTTITQPNFNLYPNPSQGFVTVELNAETSGVATLNLYTLLGEKVFFSANALSEGMNIINLNTAEFAEGIYIFEIVNAGETIRQKLVISK